jgi:hypothetical protein
MMQKTQPTGLRGNREATSAPTDEQASDKRQDATTSTAAGLSTGNRKVGVRKMNSNAEAMSARFSNHRVQASRALLKTPDARAPSTRDRRT